MLIGSSLLTRWGDAYIKRTNDADAANMTALAVAMDWQDEDADGDAEFASLVDQPDRPSDGEGFGRVSVRRGKRTPFARKMAMWARVKFPNLLNQRTEADAMCVRMALSKQMASMHVRNCDIVKMMPIIMAMVYVPTTEDVMMARAQASATALTHYNAHLGWSHATGPWWLSWLPGAGRARGFMLQSR
jgi:hypothetical protein